MLNLQESKAAISIVNNKALPLMDLYNRLIILCGIPRAKAKCHNSHAHRKHDWSDQEEGVYSNQCA